MGECERVDEIVKKYNRRLCATTLKSEHLSQCLTDIAVSPSKCCPGASRVLSKFEAGRSTKYYHKRKPLVRRLPPGPKPWPLLGCLPAMLLRTKNSPTHQWIYGIMRKFNTEIAYIRLESNTHIIPVASPELALEFL
ncbi:unnamed protein product [Citrullus colocynthis]|uniref:Uncharacterized protein n=1 Tax=Citrullus colocynthis TaxID=252529 RepID=A0ABP0Z7F8_9ROSI